MQPTQLTIPTPYQVGPVHCYTLEVNGELALIDTGPPTDEAKQILQDSIDLKRLQHVMITHCHVDHYGLAAWLQREYDVTVYIPFRDSLKIKNYDIRLNGMYSVFKKIGFSSEYIEAFHKMMDSDLAFPDFPKHFKIAEQDLPETFNIQTIPCPGHSQSDLIYSTDSWAATGDTMLREIFQSPLLDIDLLSGKRFRNYDAYCQTIIHLATLREKKILPGHREYIIGVDYNICYYTGKLLERAGRSRKLTAQMSAPEVVDKLFGDNAMDPFLKYLKTSEIIFIRDFLEHPETLKTSLQQIGLFKEMEPLYHKAIGDS